MVIVPIVREVVSIVTVLLEAVRSSVLKLAVKVAPSAMMLEDQFVAVLQMPPAVFVQVPLAACAGVLEPITPARTATTARVRREGASDLGRCGRRTVWTIGRNNPAAALSIAAMI